VSRANDNWVAQAADVAREVLAQHAEDVDRQGRWPGESVAALGESGLLGLTVPAASGGAGEGPRTFAVVTRLLAEQCASTAMIYLMHICATQVIIQSKVFPARESLLRDIAGGRHLSTLAFSEKGSRSHFWAPVSQAVARGADHQLSAEKSWVTSAGRADGYIVSTRAAGATDPLALSLYFMPRDTAGLSVCGSWDGLGLRGNASAPMRLDRAACPAASLLCNQGEGFALMMESVLPWFQLGSAAVSVGIAMAATASIRQHLLRSKLEHLGQPLASLMNLRARLAQMQIAVDTQLAFLEHVAGLMEQPAPTTLLALLESKAAAAEAALHVTDLAMRTGGGACFSRHLTVERNFRDARAGAVMAPTTDVLFDFIGRTLLDMPLL
jgi:alkylation response protein AidB-like acyl-CoA dehydrogenase